MLSGLFWKATSCFFSQRPPLVVDRDRRDDRPPRSFGKKGRSNEAPPGGRVFT